MPSLRYRSGKIVTGPTPTISPEVAPTLDTKGAAPLHSGGNCYYALTPGPLNLATPEGRTITFEHGYFVTKDKKLIAYLKQHLGELCELC